MFATASTVRNWLLLEQPGPWGHDVPVGSRLPRRVARALHALADRHPIRVVLIRRHGRSGPAARHCFLARTAPGEVWMEHALLQHPRELLEADLPKLARGERVGLGVAETSPLYLVCTNGRRDPCCAERGRPLARALEAAFGARVWECSHIGGDRFAGNLVCLPHGLYFGRLGPEDGPGVARAYAAGTVDLEHHRGRSMYDFPVQAAEHFVMEREGLVGVDDLALGERRALGGGMIQATFRGPSGSIYSVRVRPMKVDPRPLTCHALEPGWPRMFELLDLTRREQATADA